MISGQWQRVKEVLEAVDGMSASEREEALDALCHGDPELRREVDSLLAQEDRIGVLDEPAQPGMWLGAEPRQVGPYRIERLIGAGGMGAVYLASRADQQFQKHVAIKIIQSHGGRRLAQRFRSERQILAGLEHPAIARLLDGGTLEDGRPYLVMEYIEGRRIDEFVDQQKPGVAETLRLFLKLCAGVQYAHRNLVVHRDLKPGNILVTAEGEPRLLDFGIAKIVSGAMGADGEDTLPFERLLTPSSASPEQVAGGQVTTASDVYSLGLLLYRLLTGASAYSGAPDFKTNPQQVILHYDPPLASKAPGLSTPRAKELAGDLELIVAKALEKDDTRRYATIEEFAGDIQDYLDGRPIRARKPTRLYVALKFIRRNRLPVAAAAILLLAIASGLTSTILYARRAEREKEVAIERLDRLRRVGESLLFEFHDSIQDLPGSTEARALVVRRALQYLDEVAAEDSSDPAVQRDLAAGYQRIGVLLAGERGPHIGGPNAMRTAFKGYERALAIRRRLLASNPADNDLRRDLLESLWSLAFARRAQGRLNEAIQLMRERLQVIDASPRNGSFDMQYSRAATYSGLSELFRTQSESAQALDSANRALNIRQTLVKQQPESARAARALALSWDEVGYALQDQKQYGEAVPKFENSLAIFNRLAAASPGSGDLQRNVEIAEMDLCEMLARSGHPSQAIPHCRRANDIADAMRRADPRNLQPQEDLAEGYATLARAQHLRGKMKDALASARQADALYQSALAQDPDATEAAAQYSDVLVDLAGIEHELGYPSACLHLSKARSILNGLVAGTPGNTINQRRLADARTLSFCR